MLLAVEDTEDTSMLGADSLSAAHFLAQDGASAYKRRQVFATIEVAEVSIVLFIRIALIGVKCRRWLS